jgi:hypothetical protein
MLRISVFVEGDVVLEAKRHIKYFIFFAAIFFMTIGALPASADIIYDHFDDGILDSAWKISLDNVSGWAYAETGSELVVTDIIPIDGYNKWAMVTLTQSCDPLSDFIVDFDFSWDSGGSNRAMQSIILSLFDSNGGIIASAGYIDAYTDTGGEKYAVAGSNYTFYSYLPLAGDASVAITRQNGGIVDIFWDDINLLSGTSNASLSSVSLAFSYYPLSGRSIFGTESVDLTADPPPIPTPEPGTMLLIGLGLLGIFVVRKLYSEKP